jgi:hypothetical protein
VPVQETEVPQAGLDLCSGAKRSDRPGAALTRSTTGNLARARLRLSVKQAGSTEGAHGEHYQARLDRGVGIRVASSAAARMSIQIAYDRLRGRARHPCVNTTVRRSRIVLKRIGMLAAGRNARRRRC